jgi:glycylpeptide N-tetradecanoyltransferase
MSSLDPVEGVPEPAEGEDGAAGKMAELSMLDGEAVAAKKKKKKKKKKKTGGETGTDNNDGGNSNSIATTSAEPPKPVDPARDAQQAAMMARLAAKIKQLEKPPVEIEQDPEKKPYKFWKTQPVPQYGEEHPEEGAEGPLEIAKPQSEIKQDPLTLPAGFEWSTVCVDKPAQLDELYWLLNENYVEDDDNMFRFDYSREFLQWALQPPDWKQVWHCGVRNAKNKKLLAFISAIPATMRMNENSQFLVEINFLCVHKKLRSHRLAPVLIREITRRVNCEDTFQAVYTAGVVLPRPVAKCRYWHRSLDPKKLIEVKFSYLPRNMTMAKLIKSLRLPAEPATPGIRPMVAADVPAACKLACEYLKKFSLAPVFNEPDFAHWLLPRDGVISSFVVEDPDTHEVTDMISYYTLPSTIVNHPEHNLLKAAYSFYNVPAKTPLKQLMSDALILAKKDNFDVFNALDLMENSTVLEDLAFGGGDGNLQYYLYNYRMTGVESSRIGLVLL